MPAPAASYDEQREFDAHPLEPGAFDGELDEEAIDVQGVAALAPATA
jgi:hypothetical protein